MPVFPFSQRDFPPVPVVDVVYTSSEFQQATATLTATIDTGADASFAPIGMLEQISAPVGKARRARSLWGEPKEFATFIVDVRIGSITFPGISVVGYDGDEIIIGRDVLNKMQLLLDGPEQITEILEAKSRRRQA